MSAKVRTMGRVPDNLTRALDELDRMQWKSLEAVANLVEATLHDMQAPLGAIGSAADVSARCATRLRTIAGSLSSLDELRGNSQFERALELVEENSRLIQSAVQAIGEQSAALRSFARSVPPTEAPATLSRILDEVLALLKQEGEVSVHLDNTDHALVPIRGPVVAWMLLECIRHAAAIAPGELVRVCVARDEDGKVAVRIMSSGRLRPAGHAELVRWVRRAGAELRVAPAVDSAVQLSLILPVEVNL